MIILCGFIACPCVIHFYPGVEGQSGERGQEVFQVYYVVESIWLITTDSFRRVIIVKWAKGSTYSQYKGHQVGPHWKSDATSETCKGRELFFFSLLSRVSRAALQTVVQASPPKEHSQLAIYTIVTCVGARLNRTDTTFFLSLIHFFRCIYCLLSCWP
mgnify:CR=1 FL=1